MTIRRLAIHRVAGLLLGACVFVGCGTATESAGTAKSPAAAHVSGKKTTLYQKKSPYNTVIVTEENGLRTLQFEPDGARQSVVKIGDPEHLELSYTLAMPIGLAFVENPKRVLIIGLGGGSIPMFLHKHYPNMVIDVVDIDPDVVHTAREYFEFCEDENLQAHVADGRKFIEDCREPYDLILLDAYGRDSIPYSLATREFLQSVRKALTPNGAVVGNVWGTNSNKLYHSMIRTYQDSFDEFYILQVAGSGNNMFVGVPRKAKFEQAALAIRAAEISRGKKFRFDLAPLVLHGYQHMDKPHARGRILLDKDAP